MGAAPRRDAESSAPGQQYRCFLPKRMAKGITPYDDVDEFLVHYRTLILRDYKANLVGMYLTGSLTYDAFDYESSDLDVTNITGRSVHKREFPILRAIHDEMESQFPKWSRRFECTYTPTHLLSSVLPPEEPRPWYWGADGHLYEEAPYGNEWIINAHFLYECGQPIFGPEFRELSPPIESAEVRKACIRDLFTEWVPKKSDREYFKDSHHRAYFVLNLCRIITTVCTGEARSKPASAEWAVQNLDFTWKSLVTEAANWKYGVDFDRQRDAMAFLDHIVALVSATDLI